MIQRARAATVLLLLGVCAQGVAGPSATVVILPPHVKAGDAQLHAAAELLCDLLAKEVAKDKGVTVVDRAQMSRVLAERKLATRPAGPALSYDAMVRLAADGSGPVPRLEVVVVDLSMGNVIGSKQYAWAGRADEKLVAPMAELCTSATKAAATRQDGRIKVRLVSPLIADNIARLEPLAARLERTFEALVGRSAKLRQVHHLEAASAAEESLLLLMGMSRLPGGRRFAPQADATVQLRLREIDAVGKTFEQTTVRLDYCVDAPAPGRWQHLKGKVAEWDGLIASAWQAVAKGLAGADPKAARDFLNEVALRRRQAAAEIDKLHSLRAHEHGYPGGGTSWPAPRVKLVAETAAAAAKLDPTNEEAAFLSIKFNFFLRRRQIVEDKAEPRAMMIPIVHEALRHFRTYKGGRAQKAELSHEAIYWVLTGRADIKLKYSRLTSYHHWSKYTSADPPPLEVLEAIRQLVDEALSVPSWHFCNHWETGCQIRLIYEYMLSAGLDPAPCRRWRDQAILRAEGNLLQAAAEGKAVGHSFRVVFPQIRCIRIGWALGEGQTETARELLADMMARMKDHQPYYTAVQQALVKQADQMNDVALARRVKAWLKDASGEGPGTVRLLDIRWPASRLHGPVPPYRSSLPYVMKLKGAGEVKLYHGSGVQPLGVLDGRLYVCFTSSSNVITLRPDEGRTGRFASLRLTEDGRAAEEEMTLLPFPGIRRECQPQSAAICHGKVCVGSDQSGLLVFDPNTGAWTVYEAEQGLPSRYVGPLFPVGGSLVLGYSYLGGSRISWTLDLATSKVVMRRHMGQTGELDGAVWRDNGTWRAANLDGVWENALARGGGFRPWPERTPQGWDRRSVRAFARSGSRLRGPVSVVEVAGRRFLDLPDGLREIDSQGRFRQTWSKCFVTYIEGRPTTPGQRYGQFAMTVPGDLPRGAVIGHDDSVLWYQAENRLLCYDPAADTWYGPVHLERLPRTYPIAAIGVRAGVWLGWGPPLFVAKAEFMRQAAGQGKAATTAQLRRQIQESIHSSSALDQAKFALSGHEFEKAERLLTRVLNDSRDHPEALALMGLLHDVACLNRPDEALRYYRRLAALKANAPAFLTGTYLQCQCHMNAGKLDEALRVSEEAAELPGLQRSTRLALDSLRQNIRSAIRKRQEAARAKAGGG